MIYVGVDIAKNMHWACVMNDRQVIQTAPFSFSSDEAGFEKLHIAIKKHPKDKLVIGLESTAHYGETLIAFLSARGYKIALINPIETAGMRRGKIRNSKTDKIDAKLICQFLAKEEYRLLQPNELQTLELRGLCRFRQNLKKSCSRLKIQLVSYLDVSFPEFHTAFSTIHGKGAYAVLTEFPSAKLIAKANVVRLSNVLSRASHGRLGRSRADELKLLAKHSVAVSNCDMSLQIRQTVIQIQLIESQLEEIEKQIEKVFNKIDSVIKTVPGIGAINGSMILSEIGDVKRFKGPNQIIAFAGLDPIVRQSGNFRAKSSRMSKRGSSVLRYALINAAWNVSLNNDTFEAYYNEKMAQKGRHYAALGHVAGKLIRVIFAMLKNNTPFDLP